MIYFIQDGSTHFIKIGHTDGEASDRLKALQTGCPSGLVLLSTHPGTKAEERALHERFASARERGEWFRPTPELIRHIIAAHGEAAYETGKVRAMRTEAAKYQTGPDGTTDLRGKWPLTFYLAGKIKKDCWRHGLVNGLAMECYEFNGCCGCGPPEEFANQRILERSIFGEHHYSGPYFVGCDHGCFHGDDSHGTGLGGSDYGEENVVHGLPTTTLGPKEVIQACLVGIQRADVIFAWVDQLDCYGTITELGFARGLGKAIWVASPREFRDMWFPNRMADLLACGAEDPKSALEAFLAVYKPKVERV